MQTFFTLRTAARVVKRPDFRAFLIRRLQLFSSTEVFSFDLIIFGHYQDVMSRDTNESKKAVGDILVVLKHEVNSHQLMHV